MRSCAPVWDKVGRRQGAARLPLELTRCCRWRRPSWQRPWTAEHREERAPSNRQDAGPWRPRARSRADARGCAIYEVGIRARVGLNSGRQAGNGRGPHLHRAAGDGGGALHRIKGRGHVINLTAKTRVMSAAGAARGAGSNERARFAPWCWSPDRCAGRRRPASCLCF